MRTHATIALCVCFFLGGVQYYDVTDHVIWPLLRTFATIAVFDLLRRHRPRDMTVLTSCIFLHIILLLQYILLQYYIFSHTRAMPHQCPCQYFPRRSSQ